MKVLAIIPIKMGSKRLKHKNLLPFGNDTLLSNICKIALKSNLISDTYVYSSSNYLNNEIPNGIIFEERDIKFDSDSTSMNDILYNFACEKEADIYILLHATAPFLDINSINKGIEAVISGEYDSAFSAKEIHEFIWKDNKPLNYNLENVPRTQDLHGIYVETSGFYIFKSDLIKKHNRRIGFKPKMIIVNEIESIDIDNQIDYDFAKLIKSKYLDDLS